MIQAKTLSLGPGPQETHISFITCSVTLISKEIIIFLLLIIFARLLSKNLKWISFKFRRKI